MFSLLVRKLQPTELSASKLYGQDTFYEAFLKDLVQCHNEVPIYYE